MPALQIVIAGAGAAGLSAALALREKGIDPLVLEAEPRAGGMVGTDRSAGFLTERGPVGVLDRSGELARVCARLGIAPLPAGPLARARFVERDGRVHALPSGPAEAIRTPLLSAREKLALLAEPLRKRRAPGGSVADFFAHRCGPAGRFIADAVQTGIYAGDPDELEMRSCFPSLVRLVEEHGSLARGFLASRPKQGGREAAPRARLASFPSGLQELVDGLGRALGGSLRFGARLLAVTRAGDRYRLQVEERGVAAELRADRLLVALPAPEAARALSPLDAQLAARLSELAAVPLTLVHLGVRTEDVGPAQRGFGVLFPGGAVVGALFPAALWPGRAPEGRVLLTAIVGGARHRSAASLAPRELVRLVREQLAAAVGLRGEPELLGIVRWPQAVPSYPLGHAARVAEIDRLTRAHPGLALAGAWYRGVSVPDCLRDGRLAAELLASQPG